jgi:hypothetical protein
MGTRVEHFKVIGERLSNWKRWGADDRRATLNFITPERLVPASACVRTGTVFDLEALADDCASHGVWEFFLSTPPLRVVGGVRSPVAVK